MNGKVARFSGLPIADFASEYGSQITDDKAKMKYLLEKGGFPVAKGRSFWFWQKRRAIKFGIKQLNFPNESFPLQKIFGIKLPPFNAIVF